MIRKSVFYLALAALLTACASAPPSSLDGKSKARQLAETNTSMGREYMDRGQLEIALDKLKRATAADPLYAPAHTMLAVLYDRIGEPDLAAKHYRLAVEAAPKNGDVNNNYAVYLCHSGDRKLASSYFQVAMKDPFYRTPAVLFANAGSCELQAGNLRQAEKYLRQSLEYNEKFSDALLPMTSVQFQSGDYMRARAFLQRYEEVGAATAASLLLGWRIESRLGNMESANSYKEKLLERFPDTAEAAQARVGQSS